MMVRIVQGNGKDNRSWMPLGCLTTALFLATLGVSVFIFAIPLLALQDKIPTPLLGAAFSGYFFAKLLIAPLAGRLSDTKGPRTILAVSAFSGALLPLIPLVSTSYQILYLVQFGLGLAAGAMKPVGSAAVAALAAARNRGKAFSLYNGVVNAAFFLGPVIGGLLFYNRNLVPVLLFLAVTMGVSGMIVLLALPSDTTTCLASSSTRVKEQTPWLSRTALLLAVSGRTLCTASLLAFYPAMLAQSLHGPTWLTGLVFALPSLAACVFLPLGGWLADRQDTKGLALLGMALSGLCLVGLHRAHSGSAFVVLGLLLGLGSALSFPSSMTFAVSLGLRQGQTMGWFHTAANMGFVCGPLVGGAAAHYLNSIPLALAVVGLVGLALLVPLSWLVLARTPGFLQKGIITAGCLLVLMGLGQWSLQGQAVGKEAPTDGEAEVGQRYAGVAMGNVVHMTVFGLTPEQGGEASQQAFATISRLEAEYGHRNYAGSVGRVNLGAGKAPVQVIRPAFDLIARALELGRMSNGVFDVTIGAITVLPGYYREKAEADKKHLVDYKKVVLDQEKGTVFLPEKGMALDLGGLAKGAIMDSAAATLRSQGASSALVEAGGDLFCYGDRTWKVGIQNPRGDGLLGVIEVANAGVCGSGDYYQYAFTEQDGTVKRKHHILDPSLLDSADKSVAVTVVGPSAEQADALATTLFILGPKAGQKLLQHYSQSSALWVLPDASLVRSPGFPAFLQSQPSEE